MAQLLIKKKYLLLNDIDAYKISFHLSNQVWEYVLRWNNLAKDTVGKQFIRSVDSVSANIAEGFGRHSKADKIKFYRYSFASIKESQDWAEKARKRKLVNNEEYQLIMTELSKLPKLVNQLIQYTSRKLKQ